MNSRKWVENIIWSVIALNFFVLMYVFLIPRLQFIHFQFKFVQTKNHFLTFPHKDSQWRFGIPFFKIEEFAVRRVAATVV